MSLQILIQNQWGPEYGIPAHVQIFNLSVWWCGFQVVIFNFRLYVRLKRGSDDY